jgi:hypothetical protein
MKQSNQKRTFSYLNNLKRPTLRSLLQPNEWVQAYSSLSSLSTLGKATFWGFEGGLLGVAIFSLMGVSFVGVMSWLLIMFVIWSVQLRWRKKILTFVTISTLSLLTILLTPLLHPIVFGSNATFTILLVSSLTSLASFIFVALCILIHKFLSSLSL